MASAKPANRQRLSIVEEMTIYNATQQKTLLLDALRSCTTLELDLTAVGEMDTAGFQLLVLVKREARRAGKHAPIVAHSQAVHDVVDFFNMAATFGDPLLMPARAR